MVSKEDHAKTTSSMSALLPKNKYPKPLIFHDDRLVFFPTPQATLALFLYLPKGITPVTIWIILRLILPYNVVVVIGAIPGMRFQIDELNSSTKNEKTNCGKGKGVLYICTPRVLQSKAVVENAVTNQEAIANAELGAGCRDPVKITVKMLLKINMKMPVFYRATASEH